MKNECQLVLRDVNICGLLGLFFWHVARVAFGFMSDSMSNLGPRTTDTRNYAFME